MFSENRTRDDREFYKIFKFSKWRFALVDSIVCYKFAEFLSVWIHSLKNSRNFTNIAIVYAFPTCFFVLLCIAKITVFKSPASGNCKFSKINKFHEKKLSGEYWYCTPTEHKIRHSRSTNCLPGKCNWEHDAWKQITQNNEYTRKLVLSTAVQATQNANSAINEPTNTPALLKTHLAKHFQMLSCQVSETFVVKVSFTL